MSAITRRDALKLTAGLASGLALSPRRAWAAPEGKVESIRVISKQPAAYHGWPTLARKKNGQLLLVCSGGREAHVCPFGRVEFMTSSDGGKRWTWPRVLLNSALDDRDAGVVETAKGSLLVTTFSSLAYEPMLAAAEKLKPDDPKAWPADRLERWQAARDRLSTEQRQKELGVWMLRSADGGTTWSGRYDCLVNSPHGPIQLADGRLLYAGKDLWREDKKNGVCVSSDDGQSWKWLADIPTRQGDNARDYHELHAVEAGNGTLVVQIRNHNKANNLETLQCESTDGGKTWSEPHSIGVWGYPSHLLRVKDGRLLMTYGYRRKPIGNQARTSDDNGKTWSEPLIISDDATSGDMGYPSTVQLDDGTLVTVWYEVTKDAKLAVLRQATWRIGK